MQTSDFGLVAGHRRSAPGNPAMAPRARHAGRSAFMWAAAVCALTVAAGRAHAQINTPPKFIKITNDSLATVYPILYIGKSPDDHWMQAKFETSMADRATDKYARDKVYRIYIGAYSTMNGKQVYLGLSKGATIYVQAPFFSTISQTPSAAVPDSYVDWWNGGRVLFMDEETQAATDFANDLPNKVTVYANTDIVQCAKLNAAQNKCLAPATLPVFAANVGFPPTDNSQLTEYTFADAITDAGAVKKNGGVYPLQVQGVGYNISSVDQTYLPVAMEPLGNPLIPYIGTTIDVGTFRTKMAQWLADYPGWPVYLSKGGSVDPAHPRIPAAYNVFASPADLSPPGLAVSNMVDLFTHCTANANDTSTFCVSYRTINKLFEDNKASYLLLACHDPNLVYSDQFKVSKIYGWVQYNEKCGDGINTLLQTAGSDAALASLQLTYETDLQRSTTEAYNPYVKLIQGADYLDEAAYAFSVDDKIGYQHYNGTGLVYDYSGSSGLPDPDKFDKKNGVIMTPGLHAPGSGYPLWKSYAVCSNSKASAKGSVDNTYPALSVWPQSYPCNVSFTDTLSRPYSFTIQTGPNPGPMTLANCVGPVVNGEAWCPNLYVNPQPGKGNYIQVPATSAKP